VSPTIRVHGSAITAGAAEEHGRHFESIGQGDDLSSIQTDFYEKDGVRIRYQEVGSGFPLFAIPGGGLNRESSTGPTPS